MVPLYSRLVRRNRLRPAYVHWTATAALQEMLTDSLTWPLDKATYEVYMERGEAMPYQVACAQRPRPPNKGISTGRLYRLGYPTLT